MKKAIFIFATLLLFAFSLKNAGGIKSRITYTDSIKPFFDAKCLHCHTGHMTYYPDGVNLDNYDSLRVRAENGILRQRVLIKKDMPPAMHWSVPTPLTKQELNMLDSWISGGAP